MKDFFSMRVKPERCREPEVQTGILEIGSL